jgi:hypothetical protein
LKAVANTQYEATGAGELFHRVHDWGKTCEGPGAQVVAIRKTSGNNQRIERVEISISMPDEIHRLADLL